MSLAVFQHNVIYKIRCQAGLGLVRWEGHGIEMCTAACYLHETGMEPLLTFEGQDASC